MKFTLTEAAKKYGYSYAALRAAIKNGKLNCKKKGGRYIVTPQDIQDYITIRYDRSRSRFQGQPLYDEKKGTYTITAAHRKFGIKQQAIYYAISKGRLPFERKGISYIIKEQDIIRFIEKRKEEQCYLLRPHYHSV
jgi:hypothetical protein